MCDAAWLVRCFIIEGRREQDLGRGFSFALSNADVDSITAQRLSTRRLPVPHLRASCVKGMQSSAMPSHACNAKEEEAARTLGMPDKKTKAFSRGASASVLLSPTTASCLLYPHPTHKTTYFSSGCMAFVVQTPYFEMSRCN